MSDDADMKELAGAIRMAKLARVLLESTRAIDDPDNDMDWNARKLLDEQIKLHWKSLMKPVLDELERALAKAERDRDELIRRAARRLP